jgi:UDP-N-acetylmuramate--alanine ligase
MSGFLFGLATGLASLSGLLFGLATDLASLSGFPFGLAAGLASRFFLSFGFAKRFASLSGFTFLKKQSKMNKNMHIIIGGGGTGGHIFPALAIANALKAKHPDAEILFVGAENRMEMERVPAAGYKIIGLPVAGFDRKKRLKNIAVLWKLYQSLRMARKIIRDFQPDIAIGVGGYASGPILKAAAQKGIPTLLQEQNSYAGVTNKLLARKARKICVAYDGMEHFFPKDKIVLTGNPVRQDLVITKEKKQEAYSHFGLNPAKKTIVVIGGSLGARTLNESMMASLQILCESEVQWLWQSGAYYYQTSKAALENYPDAPVTLTEFISRMDLAYSVADLVISRAGAGSISEFCLLGKAVILVPSPNVAEDHQTKNALSLVKKGAALLVADKDAVQQLIPQALQTIRNDAQLKQLSDTILKLALPDSADKIVDEIDRICHFTSSRKDDSKPNLYFIGAGGIGMSNLIRYFLANGKKVAGYDKVESTLTQQLNTEGAPIHYEDSIDLIPEIFKDPASTLVVYTPAVPSDLAELDFFRKNGFEWMKRAQVLGEITKTKRGLCIAGTHGKTTTSSMIAHLLKQSPVDCNAFLGGILKNYDSNLLLSNTSDLTVIEADEYDRSFHWLTPYMAVITSVAPDHLDIYGTEEEYRKAFIHFASLVRAGGTLLMEAKVDIVPPMQKDVRLYRYAGNQQGNADFQARNIRIGEGEIFFDFVAPDGIVNDIQLGVPVEINIVNAVAALAIARLNGVSDDALRAGMASFRGAKRRFDFHIKTTELVLIDDYAHHPEELEASISSVRKLYPGRKLTVVFQPHLYSRTNDFYREFAQSLSLADEVILIPIYPARELPLPGVSSQMILDLVTAPQKHLVNYNELIEFVSQTEVEVLLIAGAGDIELLVKPIKNKLLCGRKSYK